MEVSALANRRMFSKDVVDTDKFLEMPPSTQALYFHLGMRADDDGFVSSPKKITQFVNCGNDDLKLLLAKGYLIPFESGVVVISDWNVNNWIRADRKHATRFEQEKSLLSISNDIYILDANQMPTKCQPSANQVPTKCHTEDSIGKDSIGTEHLDDEDVPDTGRVLTVVPEVYRMMKKCPDLSLDCDVTEKQRLSGVIAMVDGMDVVKISKKRMPANAGFMICHPVATVAPTKLEDYRVHQDPPGISGELVEGRIVYDAFVLDNKKKAIYYVENKPAV